MAGECGCVIEELLRIPFQHRDFPSQKAIVEAGRPTPDLTNVPSPSGGARLRYFKAYWYEKNAWVCGCKKTCSLYCWPCLLFSAETSVWTSRGVTDANSYHALKKKHELSVNHVRSNIEFRKFEKLLNERSPAKMQGGASNPERHNENVISNRYVLSCLIDCIYFLVVQELPFRSEEGSETENKGNYVEMLHYRASYDEKLRNHLLKSTDFVGESEAVRSDLVSCMAKVILKSVKEEIAEAGFVSLIVEPADARNKARMACVFRYLSSRGVQEHTVRYVPCARTSAQALAAHVVRLVSDFECGELLVTHTYDGAPAMAAAHDKLRPLLAEKYPASLYVSGDPHKLVLDVQHALDDVKGCKVFFETLNGFAEFFSRTLKHKSALDTLLSTRFPSISAVRWTLAERLVEVISEIHTELVVFFESVVNHPEFWDGETYVCSRGFHATLQEFDFNFFLNIFSTVLPQVKTLFTTVHAKMVDGEYCNVELEMFQTFLKEKRDNFEAVWRLCEDNSVMISQEGEKVVTRRIIPVVPKEMKPLYFKLYTEIFSVMIEHLQNRFSEIEKLEFLCLLNFKKFAEYSTKFPDSAFEMLVNLFGRHFDVPELKTELSIVYATPEFHKGSVFDLYKYMKESGVNSALPEVTRLCSLCLTVPSPTDSSQRSLPRMKRNQEYLRNAHPKDKFTKLHLLSVQKELLKACAKHPYFHDCVINNFSDKHPKIQLAYVV